MNGARLIPLQRIADARGDLVVASRSLGLPFDAKRVFFVSSADATVKRGDHAHRECLQAIIVVKGAATASAGVAQHFELAASRDRALYVPRLVWVDLWLHPYALVAVLCSHDYDEADYIRSRDEMAKVAA